jgi:hypothetical protein
MRPGTMAGKSVRLFDVQYYTDRNSSTKSDDTERQATLLDLPGRVKVIIRKFIAGHFN